MNADSATSSAAMAGFRFDNTYARDLEGAYVPWKAAPAPAPELLRLNRTLAEELGLSADALDAPLGACLLYTSDAADE